MLWAIVALALFAPSLAVITPGLPNDHYHSFLDPLVLALVGAGLAQVRGRGMAGASSPIRPILAAGAGLLLIAVSVLAWPPPVSPDGGWRLADQSAARVHEVVGDAPFMLDGIPPFKNANAMRFPLEHRGAARAPGRRGLGDGLSSCATPCSTTSWESPAVVPPRTSGPRPPRQGRPSSIASRRGPGA